MRSISVFLALLAALALSAGIGCDTGGVPVPDSAPTGDGDGDGDGDGTPGPVLNALGDECSSDDDCPATPAHLCVFLQSGAADRGYCSPVCESDNDCAADYTGPATSEVACFLPSGEPGCTILCDSNADCPGALECQITGGPVNVCATTDG